MRFKLLTGIHQEGSYFKNRKYYPGKTYEARGFTYDDEGKPTECGEEGQDIIETDNDLLKHNKPHSVRFEKLLDLPIAEVQSESQDDGLDDLTIKELRDHASKNGIDLGTATKHAEIVQTIRGEMQLV